jgi:hypothetical protein
MIAEASLTIQDADLDEIEVILTIRAPGNDGKLDVLAVIQDGKDCRFRLTEDRLYVKPECPGEEIELKILYEGQPRQDSEDYIRQEEIILRTDGNWLPVLPSTMANFDVTLRHPSSYTFFGQGRRVKQGRVEGSWAESRWRLEKSMGVTLYGGPRYKMEETRVGSVDIIVALWPEDVEILESVSQRATDIMKRITGHLRARVRAQNSSPNPILFSSLRS